MTRRPNLSNVRQRGWENDDGTITDGVALYRRKHLIAHLRPAQAFALADQLVDIAEEIEREESTDGTKDTDDRT